MNMKFFNFITESLTQPVQLRSVDVKECSQSFYLDHKDNVSILSVHGYKVEILVHFIVVNK